MAERAWWRGLVAGVGIGALATGIFGAVGASADGAAPIHIEVNGQSVSFDSAPVMVADHVYLPIRYVAQALGIPVHWDASTQTVLIGTVPTSANGTTGSFVYQGLRYSSTTLAIRNYPGSGNTSGAYWIVSYSLTNTGTTPINVPQQQPALALFGPGGVQLSPDAALGGPAPSVINPGISFSSYLVFDVAPGAVPSAYSLGFDTYQVVGGQFTATPVSAPLPTSGSTEVETPVSATYSLNNVWNSGLQQVTIGKVVQTTQIVPDLTAASFNPTTTFWIVDFDVTNPGPGNISFSNSNFALNFNDTLSISPANISSLPGYVAPSSLSASGGETLPAGATFSGSLLFSVPVGTPTTNPGLSLTVGGQTRIISLQPCSGGTCPPVQQ